MDHLIDVALANGAIAPKVCGAGGGGCIAFFCEDGRKSDVETALSSQTDAEVLDCQILDRGLEICVK
jgi:D-glycero-alpha-D-manno-heptose-7-phosphate kinase